MNIEEALMTLVRQAADDALTAAIDFCVEILLYNQSATAMDIIVALRDFKEKCRAPASEQ